MADLVLVVEHDGLLRRRWRRRLEEWGYEAIEAGSTVAALELLQRLPEVFRLVLVETEMPGLPGTALIETLRLFRPELPVFCFGRSQGATVKVGCPTVTEGAEELALHLREFADHGNTWAEASRLGPDTICRARERYGRTSNLVEAAYEVSKGLPPD